MDPRQEQRALDVWHRALACDDGGRDALVAELCAGDTELASRVRLLLRAHEEAGDFLETPALDGLHLLRMSDLLDDAPPPAQIGPYRVLHEIGTGGMGTVYLAERVDGTLQRTVALKVVRHDRATGLIVRRFQREVQILSGLEHPGIARLYDGGTTAEGEPYFVMEYVAGTNLVAHCDARQLAVEDRLRLFCRVCDAVQFAHQHLIVHRDLKPSNILVTADGDPTLVDFGIAKVLSDDDAGGTDGTFTMARAMTPEYASPEQVRGERVTTASDVYALGAILYEILSGERPYRLRSRATTDVERAVLDQEPAAPSAVAGTRVLARALRGDLDVITLTALQKDTARRYPTVAMLSDDLRRHLGGLPVRARPDGRAYRVKKFIGRHRTAVIAAAIAVVSLAAGLTVAVWQARVAGAERAAAEQRFDDVRRLANSLVFELHDAIQFLPGATAARQVLVTRALEYLDRLSQAQPRDPALRRELAAAYQRLGDVQGNPLRANLGDSEGAMVTYRKALALRDALARDPSATTADIVSLGDTEFEIGAQHRIREDFDGARSALAAMTARLEAVAATPGGPDVRSKLVAGYQRLAEIGNSTGRPDEAARAIARGLLHGEALVRDRPDNAAARLNLSTLYIEDRDRLVVLQQWTDALVRSHAARALQEALMSTGPLQLPATRALLFTLGGEGTLLTSIGDHPAAIRTHQRQWDVARELMKRDPLDRFARLASVAAERSLGMAERASGDLTGAIAHLREAWRLARQTASEHAANAFARDEAAGTAYVLAEALSASGRPGDREEACAAYRDARERWQAPDGQPQVRADLAARIRVVDARLEACPSR